MDLLALLTSDEEEAEAPADPEPLALAVRPPTADPEPLALAVRPPTADPEPLALAVRPPTADPEPLALAVRPGPVTVAARRMTPKWAYHISKMRLCKSLLCQKGIVRKQATFIKQAALFSRF